MKNLFLVLFAIFVSACASDPKYQVKKPFLYEVTKGDQKAHFFGSIHTGVTAEDLPDSVWPYFDQTDAFVTESSSEDGKAFVQEIVSQGRRQPEDKTLKEKLPNEDYVLLSEYFSKEYSYDSEQVEQLMKSLSLFGAYMLVSLEKTERVQVKHGEHIRMQGKFMLDRRLEERAKSKGQKIYTLDSQDIAGNAACLASFDNAYKNELHVLLTNTGQSSMPSYLKMVDDYREGIAKSFQEHVSKMPELKCMLSGRHEKWIPQIISILEEHKRPMVVVGVAHLEDKQDTIFDLLKLRGYQVRRVEFPQKVE